MPKLWRAALAGALLATPSAAFAQPSSPTMYCVPGSPFACFAMEFTMSGATGTFWLQNLQGSVTSDATPWNIPGFRVHRSNPTDEAGRPTEQMVFYGSGGEFVGSAIPSPDGASGMQEESVIEDEFTVDQTRWYFHWDYAEVLGGLYGCDLPPWIGPGDSYFGQTCPARGYDGWWRMTFGGWVDTDPFDGFDVRRDLTPEDITFEIGGCLIRGVNSGITGGQDCVASPYPHMTPVPEPGTLALLGGGLGLLGLVGWRRRRA